MIDLIAAATVGAIVGSAIMRRIDNIDLREMVRQRDFWKGVAKNRDDNLVESDAAHARATDRGNTLQARIDRLKDIASSQQSVKSARIIAVLSGDA